MQIYTQTQCEPHDPYPTHGSTYVTHNPFYNTPPDCSISYSACKLTILGTSAATGKQTSSAIVNIKLQATSVNERVDLNSVDY